jgi:hypothetical protein
MSEVPLWYAGSFRRILTTVPSLSPREPCLIPMVVPAVGSTDYPISRHSINPVAAGQVLIPLESRSGDGTRIPLGPIPCGGGEFVRNFRGPHQGVTPEVDH